MTLNDKDEKKRLRLSFVNEDGKIECDSVVFSSGDVVQVYVLDDDLNEFRDTRIEHNGREYYSVDGYNLLNTYVRLKK